jgi:hypothetical protein
VIYRNPQDQVVDDAAIKVFIDAFGGRATHLPPVAIVIAAYNEAGAIGPVVEALPAEVCGLATAVIVVADGCADSTTRTASTTRPRWRPCWHRWWPARPTSSPAPGGSAARRPRT